METINENFYRSKNQFFENRKEMSSKVFSHGPDKTAYLKHLNLDFNPEKYKCNSFLNYLYSQRTCANNNHRPLLSSSGGIQREGNSIQSVFAHCS